MQRFLYRRPVGTPSSLGLLALRLVMGAAFIGHGWGKIQSPASWMGDAVPGFLQVLAAIFEFGGGILLILGLLTPLAAFGIFCVMTGALFLNHFPNNDPFIGGYELPLTFLAAALLYLLAGPGRFSADYALFGRSATTGAASPRDHRPAEPPARERSSEGERGGVTTP